MRRRRSSISRVASALWVLLGLSVGLALGLTVAWLIWPRPPAYTDLAHTRPMYQQDYVLMVSAAYEQDGDLARAQERLSFLGNAPRVRQLVSEIAERVIEQESDLATKRRVARLAAEMGANSAAVSAYVATPEPQTPTATAESSPTPMPVATETPLPRASETRIPRATTVPERMTATPTATVTPTRQAEYRLFEAKPSSCRENSRPGYILILVRDARGEGLAGMRVRVSWSNGQDETVTGLHPDQDPGYADYAMSAGMSYTVTVVEGASDAAENLELFSPQEDCGTANPQPTEPAKPGSWRVIFEKRD